jgi:hypothetical protein
MTNIDVYEEIFSDAKSTLEKRKKTLSKLKVALDSIKKDSLNTRNKQQKDTQISKKLQ